MVQTTELLIGNTLNSLLKNPVVLDVETTIKNNGNLRTAGNTLVTVQLKSGPSKSLVFFKEDFDKVIPILKDASVVITTNGKFDLNWLRHEFGYTPQCVWDLQIAEFLFSRQMWKYPDLNTMCINYGLPPKLDIVATQYWDQGIDTTEIPRDILAEYGAADCDREYEVFLKQVEIFRTEKQHMFRLFRVQCNDMVVLAEMEWNGIAYDTEGSLNRAQALTNQIGEIEGEMYVFTKGIPINFNSPAQVSKLLYGGDIVVESRIPNGVFKSGARIGQVKYMKKETVYTFPRLVNPLKRKGDESYSVDEPTLLSLKAPAIGRKLIELLLKRVKLQKLNSTYLEGFPKRIAVSEWPANRVYSTLNQCLVVTGRLSSAKPNQQNLPGEAKYFCVSRFD